MKISLRLKLSVIQSVTVQRCPLPSPVALAPSSGLPDFSSSSSPLTLVAVVALFFLKVAGTMSAGRARKVTNEQSLTEFLNEVLHSLVGDGEVSPLPAEDFLHEALALE